MIDMDLAVKKIELINWLTTVDEKMIRKIEELRKSSAESAYKERMSEELESKLSRSEADIKAGKMRDQQEVESFFKKKI